LTYKNGEVYEGCWKDGEMNGKGIWKLANGKVEHRDYTFGKYEVLKM
jgi:hypothetical protein